MRENSFNVCIAACEQEEPDRGLLQPPLHMGHFDILLHLKGGGLIYGNQERKKLLI